MTKFVSENPRVMIMMAVMMISRMTVNLKRVDGTIPLNRLQGESRFFRCWNPEIQSAQYWLTEWSVNKPLSTISRRIYKLRGNSTASLSQEAYL